MVDLAGIQAQLDVISGQLRVLISRVETRIPDVDALGDRIDRVERIEKSLATTSLKLAAVKALSSWAPGALAGAVAGAVAAWVLLSSGIAGAH